ncbi:MAG: PQQ-binding-like beta-propeller repeat protein [Planctomycetes bacterium]|nr:PQQ-binding-like beta-propeller repeat protein [Planctomycetota bacterium]
MRKTSQVIFAIVCVIHLGGAVALADNWPAWRGPTADGQCRETDLPTTWSADENVRWKTALPGPGNSTPIVWEDRVFLTQAMQQGKQRSLICLDRRDGKILWQQTIDFAATEPTHNTNPYCSASPVTDGERVVVSHGSAGLFCYDLAGNELWRRDLGPCHHIWGNAASPVIWGELVFLNFGPGERTFLMAVDKQTGKDVWRAEEPGGKLGDKGNSEWIGSWSTPVLARFASREELILSWPGAMKSYQPRTGELLWKCEGLFKDQAADKLVYTTPLVTQDVIVAMGGFTGAWIGLKPPVELPSASQVDITSTHRLWRHPTSPQRIGSGVVLGEHVYMVNEPGTAQCIEAKTGKILWTNRLTSSTWASLVHADGHLYITSLDGESVVFRPNLEKLDVVARNKIPERTLASIAISNGDLFLRTYNHLWCLRKAERK